MLHFWVMKKIKKFKLGPIQRKILLLLFGGLAIYFSAYLPNRSFKIARGIIWEWKRINRRQLYRSLKQLHKSKLIIAQKDSEGKFSAILSDIGRWHALQCKIHNMKIKQVKWDKQWRIVTFDFPEKKRLLRDAFRRYLKKMGFYELQKSVFIQPYPCHNEIESLIEFHDAKLYVRQIVANSIDNEVYLKQIFNLKYDV